MKAGRELDKAVSVSFFREEFDPNASYPWDGIPSYSTNIVSAWQVWLKIVKKHPSWALGLSLNNKQPVIFDNGEYDFIAIAEGDTFEEAICLAALKAAEEPKSKTGKEVWHP